MPRKYTDIKQYENQIMEMRAAGKTRREIAQALGLEKEQIKGWITRFNREQRKLEAGIKPRPKGRPRKDAEPRDIVAEQAYEIERLKMENKLLRDFMRLAGRR
jgi:transposase